MKHTACLLLGFICVLSNDNMHSANALFTQRDVQLLTDMLTLPDMNGPIR